MTTTFSSQTLTEKLSKLNNSQQSIENLSHWCISHRKKAKHIIETWEKLFMSSPKEKQTSFLYLANDIIQNSRRKGSEFVNEFLKVLPGTLKSVYENGDKHGKKVVMRLVGIWEERKVFGSRGQGLKDAILGKAPLPSESNGTNSNSTKVVRKDAHLIRIKLAVGEMPEKIVTAYQSVVDEPFNEDSALNKCKAAVSHMGKMEKDVDAACTHGVQEGSPLEHQIQEQETILKQCIHQLESGEASRSNLIVLLKEALQEQDSKLELIHAQLQVAYAEVERAANMRQRLISAIVNTRPDPITSPNPTITGAQAALPITEHNQPFQISSIPPPQQLPYMNSLNAPLPQQVLPVNPIANSMSPPRPQSPRLLASITNSLSTLPLQPLQLVSTFTNSSSTLPFQPLQQTTTFGNSLSSEEKKKKAAAAAVAAKLAASTSSAQMLTSILSTWAAEEAASMNAGLSCGVFSGSSSIFPPEKRPKLDNPISASDTSISYFGNMQQQLQPLASLPLTLPPVSSTSIQSVSQTNQQQLPFPPPPPPLPPLPPPHIQHFICGNGVMVGGVPYSFTGNSIPPLPLSSQVLPMGMARPNPPQQLLPLPPPPPPPPPPPLPPLPLPPPPPPPPPPQQLQQQQPNAKATGFFQPPGVCFFGQLQRGASVSTQPGSIPNQGSST